MTSVALLRWRFFSLVCCSLLSPVLAPPVRPESDYKFVTWKVTYGEISPLGVKQRGILINGKFPGPQIDAFANDTLAISLVNELSEPFHISWKGNQQVKNSWEEVFYCTNCPVPPGQTGAFIIHLQDRVGSYYYFPSLDFHKAAGGFGGMSVLSPPGIPLPFESPSGDFTLLAGDWYKKDDLDLKKILDSGNDLPFPDGLLINGRGWNGWTFSVDQGKTYKFRISNVGLTQSINVRIEGHKMVLVEAEGSYTLQRTYSSLDVHLGQSYSVLVKADKPIRDYYIVISSRFTTPVLKTTAVLHYSGSSTTVRGPPPEGPTFQIDYSLAQARSIRMNLTANGGRQNPQGWYHYGMIEPTKTIHLANSPLVMDKKKRYAVNGISSEAPQELVDYYQFPREFTHGRLPNHPSAVAANFQDFVEIVFENIESTVQSWHIEGYSFFVVGMDMGNWMSTSRKMYNLKDAVARSTVQVYPNSWTAIYMRLDKVGTWKVRSEDWARQYLGQQMYLRVYCSGWDGKYPLPPPIFLCGAPQGR